MKITKKNEFVLLTNNLGEYHLSHEEFNNLGEEAAIKLATNEIEKKSKLGIYANKSINFEQAESLGFCKYGIEDFCKKLELDVTASYNISELLELLTVDVF